MKFDAGGNYLLSWGEPGERGGETRPGYWHNVHGIGVDPASGRVFVNDRSNHRVQVFDENGEYLYEWSFGPAPSDIHDFMITADGYLWAADRGTNKMIKYALDGTFLYAWGTWGNFPGGMWGVCTASARTPKGISTSPRWTTEASRNIRRARAPTRTCWWGRRCALPGSSRLSYEPRAKSFRPRCKQDSETPQS